jgi:nucleoside-diphosphate-sugar epimerase
MKVFVAGATGVIGWRAVRDLVAAGHEVTGLARSDEKAEQLVRLGATPARVDLFDPAALSAAVAGHAVVANLATHIPPLSAAARPSAWAENDRIRTEGSRNLVDAALAGGATRYIQESITFTYPDQGDEWIDESLAIDPAPGVESVLAAEANAARFASSGHGAGVVLRFGAFYGPGATHTDTMLSLARRGLGAAAGAAQGYISSIHLDDAARAVVAALEVPSGTYNVVDDEPVTRRQYVDALGAALGRGRLRIVPGRAAKLGGKRAATMTRSQRVRNAAFRAASGWRPQHPSVREGWPAVVAAVEGEEAVGA